jgi:hypothetical protein
MAEEKKPGQGWEKTTDNTYKATFTVNKRPQAITDTGASSGTTQTSTQKIRSIVNNETGAIELYEVREPLGDRLFNSFNPSTGKWVAPPNDVDAFVQMQKQIGLEGLQKLQKDARQGAVTGVINPTSTQENKDKIFGTEGYKSQSNSANTNPNSDSSTEGAADLAKEAGTTNKNTRKTYQLDVKYPLNLKSENQDCIKFSIVEYKPPGLKPGASEAGSRIVTLNSSKPEIAGEGRTILGTITLPIPGGISDRNSADWSGNSLGEITKFFAGISMQGILGGGAAAGEAAQDSLGAAMPDGDTSSLQSRVAAAAVQGATGSSGILARQYGAVSNENLELLFNGPTLRNFAFNFRFTPREEDEAVAVRRIIRYFKQAMSVKRSESSLLLKSPHTFAISYLSKNKDHPYLNKFKECALTDCAVNYTPDGTYMTYTDSSMTAYELSLTFQELEPIFDDDYFEIDKNQDTSIGF